METERISFVEAAQKRVDGQQQSKTIKYRCRHQHINMNAGQMRRNGVSFILNASNRNGRAVAKVTHWMPWQC